MASTLRYALAGLLAAVLASSAMAQASKTPRNGFGQPDFSSLAIDIGDARITYGNFLNVVLSFIVVGFVLFLVVKAYNRLRREEEATMKACPFCASDIPLAATRCPSCTSQLEGAAA